MKNVYNTWIDGPYILMYVNFSTTNLILIWKWCLTAIPLVLLLVRNFLMSKYKWLNLRAAFPTPELLWSTPTPLIQYCILSEKMSKRKILWFVIVCIKMILIRIYPVRCFRRLSDKCAWLFIPSPPMWIVILHMARTHRSHLCCLPILKWEDHTIK